MSAPLQVMWKCDRLVIFVDAKKGNIQVITRVSEIVRITTEKSGVVFRSKDQSDVGILLILIKVEDSASIQGDHIATQSSLVGTLFLKSGHSTALQLERLRRIHLRLYCLVNLRSDVFNGREHVEL